MLQNQRLLKKKNKRLAETDWMANSDVTMTDDWKNYRQALRDLPASSSPKLTELDGLDFTSVTGNKTIVNKYHISVINTWLEQR